MFTAVKTMAPIDYADPWNEDLDARLVALARGHRRIAYFYETPDTSTFRYRVWNMIEALEISPDRSISAAWFCTADLAHMARFIDRADVLVICRTRYTAGISRLIARARARNLRILFDVDDLVFDTSHTHLIMDTLDQDIETAASWDHWFAYLGRLGAVLRLCDGVIVTNAYLAERAAAFAPDVPRFVIPNFLNRAQIALSETIYQRKAATGFASDGRTHLGYFSGTPTHNRDFQVVSTGLADLLDSDPLLAVTVVGFLELRGAMERHRARIGFVKLQDFLNLQISIGATEFNLVPLQDNTFTNCKSELKYFEAAIAGTVSIASPTFALRRSIVDGENGFLARAQDWSEALREVLRQRARYPEIAAAAHRHALANYTAATQVELITSVLA